jgi:nucleoside-diphosphate-sugar epimerase
MASLLIIGGSGFFGKSILDAYRRGLLVEWGIDSISIIARTASNLQKIAPELIHPSIELLNIDVATCQTLPNADYVIHAAASTDVRNYIAQPLEERRNILLGTLNYCNLSPLFHPNSKIVYVSSGAIYGAQPQGLGKIPEDHAFDALENMILSKQDYAAAKRDSEGLIQKLGVKGLNVAIARCFAFVGPYLPLDQHFAIGNFIKDGMRKEAITVKASHPVYRSYMYSDDLVRWLMTIAENATPDAPCFNVGSDEAISVMELANKVAARFGVSVNYPAQDKIPVDRYIPSIEKARRELGLTLHFNLDQAIEKTIENLQALVHV